MCNGFFLCVCVVVVPDVCVTAAVMPNMSLCAAACQELSCYHDVTVAQSTGWIPLATEQCLYLRPGKCLLMMTWFSLLFVRACLSPRQSVTLV